MRVSTRIIFGLAILLAVAVGALAYQVRVIHQMQSINRDLSAINFRAASTALRMVQISDTIGEFSRKYFVASDAIYDRQLVEVREEFLGSLVELQNTVRSGKERDAVQALAAAFDDYWNTFNRVKKEIQPREIENLPPDLNIAVDHLQAQTEVAYDAVQVSIRDEVERAAQAGQRGERLSWTAGLAALLLSIIVAFVIVRAINDPLRRLTHGTRAIAKGEFWHRLRADGSDEFSEVARDFNVMTQKLAKLDEMKKDFVSHVSHDLKAPLASIRQVMHVLLQEIPGALNEQQKSLLRLSYNSAERLSAMVANLLDVSRMEAGTMEYEIAAHDLMPIIRSVAEEFEVQVSEKRTQIQIISSTETVFAECDRSRIAQVIGNLFENAVKFSPPDSQIITRVNEGANGSILVSVSDSGPGVPDAHKDKIFLKFHQLKEGKKVAGQGVGLGLAICKTIVEAHHGEIWVEDNPNGGSVFSFSLEKTAAQEEVLKCGQSA